jgi:hypothetical protein
LCSPHPGLGHWIERQTGWSIKKFVRAARRYRTCRSARDNKFSLQPTPYPRTSATLSPKPPPRTVRTNLAEVGPVIELCRICTGFTACRSSWCRAAVAECNRQVVRFPERCTSRFPRNDRPRSCPPRPLAAVTASTSFLPMSSYPDGPEPIFRSISGSSRPGIAPDSTVPVLNAPIAR